MMLVALVSGCDDKSVASEPGEEPAPTFDYPLDDILRIHHLQAKSTHNSYHIESEGSTLQDWAYTMAPLDVQLGEQGVRQFEIDLRYSHAKEIFEVYHIGVIDEQTTCRELTTCLATLKAWSDTHRAHHPMVVQFEVKDGYPGDEQAESYFAKLHNELTSVWPLSRIVTPKMVQGSYASLPEALLADGWPTLGQTRGMILFTMNNGGDIARAYTHEHSSLEGRLIFPQAVPGDAWAAIAVLNDPDDKTIPSALAANMLVRTRADSGGNEAVANDKTRFEAALASGAHFITTDFPAPVDAHDYWIEIPGGTPSRCNPASAPAECTSKAIEDPKYYE